MNKYIEITLIIVILALTAALAGVFILKFNSPIKVELPNLQMNAVNGEVQDFLLVAERFADNHEYNRTGYNCVNYSHDLKAIADQLGFKTKIIRGCPEEGICHEWLELNIDFEPQQAKFVDYSKEYPYNRTIVR